jgi:hypothetical protein
MRLLVDVVDERLQVDGFRLSASNDLQADKPSWDIWQANQMDSLSRMAFLDSLVKGVSYISVWGDADGDGFPDIRVEDATETIVAYTPGSNFLEREAALKVWKDEFAKLERATVYLPDGVYKFQRSLDDAELGTAAARRSSGEEHKWEKFAGASQFVVNKAGVVPIIPLRNRGRLLTEGESEIADACAVQNQINGFLFLLALAGYFGAHRQRWAVGIKLAEDENTGDLKDPWDTAIDKLWATEDPDVKLGEFSQTDMDGYIKAIEQKVAHLAVVTRTPKHYLLPEGQNPSGDAIKSSESGLVRKIGRKQTAFGEALEEVMQLARKFDKNAEPSVDSEVVWADAETESEAARADAVIKKFEAKLISREQALEDLGYSQVQITRMLKAQVQAALIDSLAPAPTPEAPPEAPAEEAPAEQ